MRSILSILVVAFVTQAAVATVINVPGDQPTIQAGINAASNGDIVLVSDGTYDEQIDFQGKNIVVRSANGPEYTEILGSAINNPSHPTVLLDKGETVDAVLQGFTLRGGPIAIFATGAPTIKRNILTDQTYDSWAALVIEGGGRIINNTICHGANGGIACYSSSAIIKNNIIVNNAHYGIFGSVVGTYNDVYGSPSNYDGDASPGPGSISVDPEFIDESNRDYRLTLGSPCINSGDPDPQYNDPDDTPNDMGAIPFNLQFPLATNIGYGSDYDPIAPSLTPTIYWSYYDTAATTQMYYEIEVGTDLDWTEAEMWATGAVNSPDTSAVYQGLPLTHHETYYVRIHVHNGIEWGGWNHNLLIPHSFEPILVPAEQPTIQAAVNVSLDGDTILVSAGDYVENINLFGRNIYLFAVDGPGLTTLQPYVSSQPTLRIISGETDVEISGFTFVGGTGQHAVLISNGATPVISRNVFRHYAGSDVLIRAMSDAVIKYNLFYENGGNSCIGISAGANAIILNNTFDRNNRGFNSISSSGIAKNNVVTNSNEYGIFGMFTEKDYNDVWNNDPDHANGVPGAHDISADPLYVDPIAYDYSLEWNSPCVDAGDPDPQYDDPDGTRNDMGAFYYYQLGPHVRNINFGTEDMLHVVDHDFTIYWSFFDLAAGQEAYEIEVGTDHDWTVPELWATGEVISTDTFAVYGGGELLDGNIYHIRIRVSNGTDWSEWRSEVFRMNSIPTVPILSSPIAGSLTFAVYTRLFVDNASDPEGDNLAYDFEVYSDAGMVDLLFSVFNIFEQPDSTGSNPVPDLEENTTYWWRARSTDGYEHSPWSAPGSFVTTDIPEIHVPADQPTIQAAIQASEQVGLILVDPGVYQENIIYCGKKIRVVGSGPGLTFLTPLVTSFPAVTIMSGEDVLAGLSGFTVYGGDGSSLVRIGNGASPTITDCIFHSYCGSSDRAENVVIRITSDATITYNLFANNGGISCIGISDGGRADIINNTFDGNNRGFHTLTGKGRALNNIVTNSLQYGVYGQFGEFDYNCIWNNHPDYDGGASPGIHDISSDPLFVNPASGNYHLRTESPCVDAGHPDPLYNDANGTRNDMGAFPLYPSLPWPATINLGQDEDVYHIINDTPAFYWTFLDTIDVQEAYEVEVGTDLDWTVAEMWASGPVTSSDTFAIYAGDPLVDGAIYYCRMRVSNGLQWGEWAEFLFRMNDKPSIPDVYAPADQTEISIYDLRVGVNNSIDTDGDAMTYGFEIYTDQQLTDLIYIKYNAVEHQSQAWSDILYNLKDRKTYWWRARAFDGYEYSGWSTTWQFTFALGQILKVPADYATIQEAIDAAGDGDAIMVGSGNYSETIDFHGKYVKVIGRGAENTSLTPASPKNAAVYFQNDEGPFTEISGFTIHGGTGYNLILVDNGAEPTIRNNTFTGFCSAKFNNVVIRVMSNAMIADNLFHENAGISCIGISDGGTASIVNNTFDRNNRGFHSVTGRGVAINNIVTNSSGYGIYGAFEVLDYNCVWNNQPNYTDGAIGGEYSISEDPLYLAPELGFYILTTLSPCVDAGNPLPQYNDADGSRCDMGAFSPEDLSLPIPIQINWSHQDPDHIIYNMGDIYWVFLDSDPLSTQQGYEIEVGTDEDWTAAEMWATGQVASSDSSAIYIGEHLEDGETYYLRMRVSNGESWGSWRGIHLHINAPPSIPAQVWPLSGMSLDVGSVYLSVANSSDAEKDRITYSFEVYNTCDIDDIALACEGVEEQEDYTTSGLLEGLDQARYYWWRARAYDGYEYSRWTPFDSFMTSAGVTIRVPQDIGSIQAAINVAGDCDVVLVAPGEYSENINFIGKRVRLQSSDGPEATTLMPEYSDRPLIRIETGEGIGTRVSGFTLTGSLNWSNSSICLVKVANGSTPSITNNVFRNFEALTEPLNSGAIVTANSSPVIKRNVFYDNVGGCILVASGGATIENNTLDRNLAGVAVSGADTELRNNIVTYSSSWGLTVSVEQMSVCDYNCIWNNHPSYSGEASPGPHSFPADPEYIDADAHNYRLSETSPCMDSGDPATFVPYYGGLVIDIGAFEVYQWIGGDANTDGKLDVSDAIFIVNYVFKNGPAPDQLVFADCNSDCKVNIADAVYLILHIFSGGPAPEIGCAYSYDIAGSLPDDEATGYVAPQTSEQ